MAQQTNTLPILDVLWVADGARRAARNVLLAALGTVLLTVSAKVQVPMWPVPMTMQPLAVLLIGMAFGWRLGGATVALYLLQGAAGAPVFAKGGGLAYLAGPTGGYLVGFLAAAVVVGWLAQRGWDRSAPRSFLAMVLGIGVIYLFGVSWLATLIGPGKAVSAGMLPFLLGDLVKAVAATAIMPVAWRMLGRGSSGA
jgi:biotin transport system substrate-specific component